MGRLNRELEKKYQMWKNIRTEISSLQTDLGILTAVVDDHQTMPAAPRTAVTRVYGKEIHELTHDIEDYIERFLHHITCKSGASRAHRSIHAIRTFRLRLWFAAKIKEFKSRVAEAHERALNAAMLAHGAQASSNETARQSMVFAQDCHHHVGIEEAVMELRRLLDIEPNQGEAEGTPAAAQAQLRVVARGRRPSPRQSTTPSTLKDHSVVTGLMGTRWIIGMPMGSSNI
ncbi:hypothetical protein ZWY2020_021475 [Hordeum vulgare]|nr:hypothetical protein ZWY2020_021475 [Hordeum vulgare]